MFARSRAWWETRVLADREGTQLRVVYEVDGSAEAYARYRIRPAWEQGSSTGAVEVGEALAVSPRGTREIWRFLFEVDWMERVRATLLPVDHPLFLLLADARRMAFRVGDGPWVRLVDVGAALAARSYAAGDAVIFDVVDDFCPWNQGRWRLEGGEAERTEATADIRLGVAELASVYLGGFTFAQLARAVRVEELAEGAVARADAVFRTDRAPWCPEIF